MEYYKKIQLKDGRECIIRSGTEEDGQGTLDNFILTHEQTDYLLTYADENTMTAEQEGLFLQKKADSETDGTGFSVIQLKSSSSCEELFCNR